MTETTPRQRSFVGRRRRACLSWTATAGMTLVVFFLASTSTTQTVTNTHTLTNALAVPKLQTRSYIVSRVDTAGATTSTSTKPSSTVGSTIRFGRKVPLEFEQRSEKEEAAADKEEKELSESLKLRKNGTNVPPGSPLSMICDDAAEEDSFEIHVGRALDTLRSDYPKMLTDKPDYAIFDKDLEVIDPSGVKLYGLKNYKGAFKLIHALVQVFYCTERSGLTFRLCYDKARQNIRVSWNAEVVPKAIFGGVRTTLHVDGISVYEISRKSGMITQHRIEHLVINDDHIKPREGIFALLRNEHEESVPVFSSDHDESISVLQGRSSSDSTGKLNGALEFRSAQQSSLFTRHDSSDEIMTSSTTLQAAADGNDNAGDSFPGLDWDAYEKKNASRKKFGLKAITPEEFLEMEAQIQQLDSRQRQQAASASAAAEIAKKSKSRREGFLEKLLGDIVPEACESNFDCVRPEICCDFGFKKVCCSSGSMVGNQGWERALVPVPVDVYQPGQGPQQPGTGGQSGRYY